MDDFNGDTIADLLIGSGTVSVRLGRGDGTFHSSVLSFRRGGSSIVVGEFNGDGRKDLAGTGYADVGGAGLRRWNVPEAWNYETGGGYFLKAYFARRRSNCRPR